MGDTCNFDCVYCDRDFIKHKIGSQNLLRRDTDEIVSFMEVAFENAKDLRAISFHGGEPFLYIKRIDEYMDKLYPLLEKYGIEVYITTNGSHIVENEWFFEKWKGIIHITLSYDFNYQEVNREYVDLKALSEVIYKHNCYLMFQFVVPTDGFNEETIANVISSSKLARCNTINVIPLRHHRGKDKFKVFVDDMNHKWYRVNLMRFIQTLYVHGMVVNIDGNYGKIDKHYLDNHGKIIISPDGYLYPEFDWLEYKNKNFRVGKWKDGIELYRKSSEEEFLLDKCKTCPMRSSCGLKYIYYDFGGTPQDHGCVEFYKTINLMVAHLHKLKEKPTLMHWIGI